MHQKDHNWNGTSAIRHDLPLFFPMSYCPRAATDGVGGESVAICRHSDKARRIWGESRRHHIGYPSLALQLSMLNALHPNQQGGTPST